MVSIYTVDVFSGSADSIVTDSHAQGVIIKATQGTNYVNPKCNHQWDLAGANGKLRGLYHYAAGGDPVAEAQYFLNNIHNYIGKAVLAVDWEKDQNSAWGNTNWVRKFVDEVHRQTNIWPLIYCQVSSLDQIDNCSSDCGLWVADYKTDNWTSWDLPNIKVPTGSWDTVTGWQFGSGGMDKSIFYLDEIGWNKLANPNESSKPSNPDKPSEPDKLSKPLPTPQEDVIRQIVGEYGYDTETGNFGRGYSPDNGKTFIVQDTTEGRKYRQDDAERLWKLLKPMVETLIDNSEGDKQNGSGSNVSK